MTNCACGNQARKGQHNCNSCHAKNMREFRAVNTPSDEQRRKANCRSYLHVYVKRGKISKLPCAVCGTMNNIEGHHRDHSKPLDVAWLCRGHHVMVTLGILSLNDVERVVEQL